MNGKIIKLEYHPLDSIEEIKNKIKTIFNNLGPNTLPDN